MTAREDELAARIDDIRAVGTEAASFAVRRERGNFVLLERTVVMEGDGGGSDDGEVVRRSAAGRECCVRRRLAAVTMENAIEGRKCQWRSW